MRGLLVLWWLAAGCGGETHFTPPGEDAGPARDAATGTDAGEDAAPPDAGLDAGVDSGCHDDVDQDGFDSPDCGGNDCNDADPTIKPRAEDPGEWLFERADELGWAVRPAIAAGADGVPHALFEDRTSHAVVHATRVGDGVWARDVVEAGGGSPAAAVGADGRVHAVYVLGAAELRHAVLEDDGTWTLETAVTVDAGHEVLRPALAAGADGALVATFTEAGPEGAAARVATSDVDGAPWAVEDVATEGGTAEHPDGAVVVALGPDGVAWAAWDRGGSVFVAARSPGGWAIEELALVGPARAPSLAVGVAGQVVVGYFHADTRSMRVARRGAETWTTETVDDRHGAGASSAIALDAAGVVHLVYHAPDRFDTRWATDAYGAWLVVTLDRSAEPDVAVAIDPAGTIHAAYPTSDSDLHWSHHIMGDGIDQDCSGIPDDG